MALKKHTKKLFVPCAMLIASIPFHAMAAELDGTGMSGTITGKTTYFGYTGGEKNNLTHFMERYNYQQGWTGSNRSDFYLDMDLDLKYSDGKRDLFTLERRGEGNHNQSGSLRFNADKIGFDASYSHIRTATNGIDYLFSANRAPGGTDPANYLVGNTNSGFLGKFNDDSNQTTFKVDRTTYGAAIKFKPALFGDFASATIGYDGFSRDGNKLQPYIFGGSDITGGVVTYQRWRAIDQPINETMNRVSFNLTLAPKGLFEFAYDGSVEKFENKARRFLLEDMERYLTAGTTVAAALRKEPLGYVPDSTLMSHGVRISKTFENTALAAGYGLSILEQDTIPESLNNHGYNRGQINTQNANANFSHNFSSFIGVDASFRYDLRNNHSSRWTNGTDIRNVATMNYGLSATLRPTLLKSTITPGWQHKNIDRDFTFRPSPGVIHSVSMLQGKSITDEIYLKWVARPIKGLTLRITPLYAWSARTGLVSEPSEAFKVKNQASYTTSDGGMTFNGYYNFENRKNNDFSVTDKAAPGATYKQKVEATLHSAGLSVDVSPSKKVNASLSVDWNQDTLASHYLTSGGRRWDTGGNLPVFRIRDTDESKIDTYSVYLGADWQVVDRLKLNASYTLSHTKGDNASGEILAELASTIDGRIDNTLHSASIGTDLDIRKNLTLKLSYIFDYYKDSVYKDLSGGINTVMAGVSYKF